MEAIAALIPVSARALSKGFYTERETESAIRFVFGPDRRLIEDGTYFVVEDGQRLAGCGGWSRRRTLYGGDQRPVGGGADDALDPAVDAARIRAFFVAGTHARRGIGARILDACTEAAFAAGFTRFELMSTLPGVPFYEKLGFQRVKDVHDTLPDGTVLDFVLMARPITAPAR